MSQKLNILLTSLLTDACVNTNYYCILFRTSEFSNWVNVKQKDLFRNTDIDVTNFYVLMRFERYRIRCR